jgi:glycosyltransferase involved in cell wall biosynthesis
MKILQVIDRLEVGGAERVAVDLSILLSKNNSNSVDFLCLLDTAVLDDELLEENVKILYLNRRQKFNPFTLIKALKILNRYDIVHVHSRHVLRYVGLTFLPLLKRRFKLIFHDHYGAIETDTNVPSYLKFCVKKASAYIGVSSSLTKWATINKLNKHIYLLSNIVRSQPQNRVFSTKSKVVVVGNFRPQKNYEFLCNLISILPNDISIDLYGTIVDQSYYNKIIALKDELNINDRIQIITSEKNITQVLTNYKLGLHCAESETGPLVAIEYLSKELPVLMYQTGEVADTVSKYSTQLLMTNFELNHWKEKIIDVLNNESKRLQLVEVGSKVYNDNYSEVNYTKTCQNIYQDIINS